MRTMTSILVILHAFVATGLIGAITHLPMIMLALQTYIVREYFVR